MLHEHSMRLVMSDIETIKSTEKLNNLPCSCEDWKKSKRVTIREVILIAQFFQIFSFFFGVSCRKITLSLCRRNYSWSQTCWIFLKTLELIVGEYLSNITLWIQIRFVKSLNIEKSQKLWKFDWNIDLKL